jgi:hypothetical protein
MEYCIDTHTVPSKYEPLSNGRAINRIAIQNSTLAQSVKDVAEGEYTLGLFFAAISRGNFFQLKAIQYASPIISSSPYKIAHRRAYLSCTISHSRVCSYGG